MPMQGPDSSLLGGEESAAALRIRWIAGFAIVSALAVTAACGAAGHTTCAHFVKMSTSEREHVINKWEPGIPRSEVRAKAQGLFESCSDPRRTDPSDRIQDISP